MTQKQNKRTSNLGRKELPKPMRRNIEVDILNSLQHGKKPSLLNIPSSTLSYHLKILKEQGKIQKVGYGTWEKRTSNLGRVATTRGHAFMWKVRLGKSYNWNKLLSKSNIDYKMVTYGKIPRILFQNKKIWMGKKLIIYEPESFMGTNALETRKYAVYSLISCLQALERRLGINLKPYEFQVARQHYSLIKNSLAIQCDKTGQKIQVYNKEGLWFIIDNSYNLQEAETIHPESAMIDSLGVQKYFNSHKETGFKVTPEFTLECFNKIAETSSQTQQLLIGLPETVRALEKQIQSHLKLIKEYRRENRIWRAALEQKYKIELGKYQRTLADYSQS